MRFHVLAIPHTVTTPEYSACAFTQKVLKFCKMMTDRGHTVFHYGHEDSDVVCTEHITVTTNQLLLETYGTYDWKKESFRHNVGDKANKTFNERAIVEIYKRKQYKDYLLAFWNCGHSDTLNAHKDLICVEPGIGCFNSLVAPYCIFESYAVMHWVYAKYNMSPRWLDSVIPNYFDEKDFAKVSDGPYCLPDTCDTNKAINALEPGYVLFLGRMIECKGIGIVSDVTKRTGDRLVLAGQEDPWKLIEKRESTINIGYVTPEQRKALLSKAKCLMAPSHYAEPFGGVNVEAQMAGVPVLTSDWGAFCETVKHGVTGYRCRVIEHFVWALKNVHRLNKSEIQTYAIENYSLNRVAKMYEEYFAMIATVFGQLGFYQPNDERKDLEWLERY